MLTPLMDRDPMAKDSQPPRRAADATSAPEYVIRGNLGSQRKEGRVTKVSPNVWGYLADADRDRWTKRLAIIPSHQYINLESILGFITANLEWTGTSQEDETLLVNRNMECTSELIIP